MKEVIKKRTIPVKGMTCEGCELKLNKIISELKGVKNIVADRRGFVHVEYNILEVTEAEIEKSIGNAGYEPAGGIWNKLRRGFINFTEENEISNMKNVHSCCSAPEAEKIASARKH